MGEGGRERRTTTETRRSTKSWSQESLRPRKQFFRSEVSISFIDTREGICEVIEALMDTPATPPSIYIDLEGMNLGREGRISIIQIFLYPHNHIYLVDIRTLGATAFNHAATTGTTLRSILESFMIPKVFLRCPERLCSHVPSVSGGIGRRPWPEGHGGGHQGTSREVLVRAEKVHL